MKGMFKTILSVLIAALLLGGIFAFIERNDEAKDDKKDEAPPVDGIGDGEEEEKPVNIIGGNQGFTTDFENLSVIEHSLDQLRLTDEEGTVYPSQLFREEGYGEISVEDGKLKYECTMSASSSTYPKFKIKPLENDSGKIYLNQFKVLTVDFDIEYDVDPDTEYTSGFRALFNTRSDSTGATVCSNSDYHIFDTSGKGHYTFIYYNTGSLSTMKIFVYKDGVLKETISNFIYSDRYDGYDLYVSCLNLELTRNQGDTVSVDNVEFHYFDNNYTGPIMDVVVDPNVNLATCKDSVLYGG